MDDQPSEDVYDVARKAKAGQLSIFDEEATA
jgi:hypothetical protein